MSNQFYDLPLHTQLDAARRASALDMVENYCRCGCTTSAAIAITSGAFKVSPSTIWRWVGWAAGASEPLQRLAWLATPTVPAGDNPDVAIAKALASPPRPSVVHRILFWLLLAANVLVWGGIALALLA